MVISNFGSRISDLETKGRRPTRAAGERRRPQSAIRDLQSAIRNPQSATRSGIEGTAYDTAWLAGVPDQDGARASRFPAALQWLTENQLPDGSWGGAFRYEHDRVLSTLAALPPMAMYGRREKDRGAVEAGTRYLWQRGHLLVGEPSELVGFELLLPALVQRVQEAGIPVPPHLDIYKAQRAQKLRLIPPEALYSPRVTVVHSLEFLWDQADLDGLRAAQGPNGGIGNSPAATAFFLSRSNDARALGYLQSCLDHTGGATVPVLHPCETFELLWAAYHLFLAGVPARELLDANQRRMLRAELEAGGVSLSPTFPIPDADDTAVALLLLHECGEEVVPSVLEAFSGSDGYFVSFPYERHSSVGVNLHVLHALLRVPGYPQDVGTIERLLEYLESHQVDRMYWIDKWHISPYYATAHALCVLAPLARRDPMRLRPMLERSREWLRQTQNEDGSWGFYGQPTVEETAYGVLALLSGSDGPVREADRRRCDAAAAYLSAVLDDAPDEREVFPPLWIDKCLYTPTLVVRSVVEAALRISQSASRNSQFEITLGRGG